jgi:hypothetical protein
MTAQYCVMRLIILLHIELGMGRKLQRKNKSFTLTGSGNRFLSL